MTINIGSAAAPVATICHSDDNPNDPNHRRVPLWIEDGYIMGQASDEDEPHAAGTGRYSSATTARAAIETLWRDPAWDLRWSDDE